MIFASIIFWKSAKHLHEKHEKLQDPFVEFLQGRLFSSSAGLMGIWHQNLLNFCKSFLSNPVYNFIFYKIEMKLVCVTKEAGDFVT
jgi:hypothetical protein